MDDLHVVSVNDSIWEIIIYFYEPNYEIIVD